MKRPGRFQSFQLFSFEFFSVYFQRRLPGGRNVAQARVEESPDTVGQFAL